VILLRLAFRNLGRRLGRTILTGLGVACALLLLVLTGSMRDGLDRALSGSDAARTLVVYRLNRYCPQTSFLPERYVDRISEIDGVETVLPVKVFLNNCRASLDVVAFQGAPVDRLFDARAIDVVEGDVERFRREKDAALIGRAFAARKGLSVGDQFRFGAIDVKVAGVFRSGEPVEEGVVLTHLEYLQRAGPVDRLGTVTQFEVKIRDAARAKEISETIDALFATSEEPTDTRAKVAFLEAATSDLREILRFAGALGLACVVVVLALVANTTIMSTQERAREFGVLRTLGYPPRALTALVAGEAAGLALLGGALGVAIAVALVSFLSPSFGAEGVTVAFATPPSLALKGISAAVLSGVAAGILPAWRVGRIEVAAAIRGG
jgi:putative ABC transport system permease protein